MNFARTIYGGHAGFFPAFVFAARTTRRRDFMTRVSAEVLYITSLSRTPRHRGCRASCPISYRILLTDACTDRNLREFNPAGAIRTGRAETGRRDAGYKLDELRSRLTPPFPHPSAKLVEFSAILPPGNLNLVPRRYLPSLLEIYYGARPHKGRCRRRRRAPISNATSVEIERRIQIGPRGAG